MAQRLRVFELARELGVSALVIIQVAEDLDLPVRRAIAELTPRQEQLIRNAVDRGGWRGRKRRVESAPEWSNRSQSPRYATCECCNLHFIYLGLEKPWCDRCDEHYEIQSETADRTIVRLRDHEQRIKARFEVAATKASEYEVRMKSAYESRQKWKAALVEIAVGHEAAQGGKCTCGASESPCATMRLLEYYNKGISRQVEWLTGLSREELDRQLYPDEPWTVDLKLDDDPPATAGTNGQPAA
jgi:hypothetical protein